MRKVDGGIADLARTIGDKEWAAGQFGLADFAAGCVLGYLDVRFPELDWRGRHPNLDTYTAKLFASPSFQATMPVPQIIRDAGGVGDGPDPAPSRHCSLGYRLRRVLRLLIMGATSPALLASPVIGASRCRSFARPS